MAHAQKPDFVFRRSGRVHLNRRVRQLNRLLAAEVSASAPIVGSNAGYTMFLGSEKGTVYPLHSPVSPSLPVPYDTVCHDISTGVYPLPVMQRKITARTRNEPQLSLRLAHSLVAKLTELPRAH
jgi:hypothetical protein